MSALRKKGVFLSNSFGVIHPSQPNYIASISGDLFGFNSDDPGWAQRIGESDPDQPPITTIVDLLEAQGYSWKAYAQDLQESNKDTVFSFCNVFRKTSGTAARLIL